MGKCQMRKQRKIQNTLTAALATTILASCASLGPSSITWNRTDFNKAIQQTDAQQLLLNIVRQRFNDPVMFLDVASVSSSMSRSTSLNLSAFVPTGPSFNSYTGGLGGAFSESPLIFYTPNTGEKFVRQILTPLDLRTLSLMLESGWSIERILLVSTDAINDIRNSTVGAGPRGENPYTTFRQLLSALRDLQRDGRLIPSLSPNGDALILSPSPEARDSVPYKTACQLLSIPCDGSPIRLRPGIGTAAQGSGFITLTTRSLYGAFYFLSDGVDVSPGELARGTVKARSVANGPFDNDSGLFHIRTSASDPGEASIKVPYRDSWYYIAENDSDTKTTFALISMMLMLQSGDTARIQPLVSIPAS